MTKKVARSQKPGARITTAELAGAAELAMEEARHAIMGEVLPVRPPGFFTTAEYAERHGIPHQTAGNQLAHLVDKGLLVRKRAYFKRTSDRRRMAQNVFGLAKKKP
jgi:hypothetical protein